MAKMTRQQVDKINSELKNGWAFNLHGFLMRGEKTVHLIIPQESGCIEAILMFSENMINRWCGNGTYHIDLHITRWFPSDTGGYISHGLGQWVNLGGEFARRDFRKLMEKANDLTADYIMSIHEPNVTNYSGLYA